MALSKRSHVHKLKRHTYENGEQVYFCVDNCKFKINVKLALGKMSICNKCGKEFQLNEYSIRLAKPHCNECTKKDEPLQVGVTVPKSIASDVEQLRNKLQQVGRRSIEDVNTDDTDLL